MLSEELGKCAHNINFILQSCHFKRCKKKYSRENDTQSIRDAIKYVVYGIKSISEQTSAFTRMAVLEARAAKRASIGRVAYLPFMFFLFGFVMGELPTSYKI